MEFLHLSAVLAIHDRQLGEHGGLFGIRDQGLLESALTRPENKHHYGEEDPYTLAAAYAYGIARNHPFLDGNKRTALNVALVFLRLNNAPIPAPDPEIVERMVQLAEGALSEPAFAKWLRASATGAGKTK